MAMIAVVAMLVTLGCVEKPEPKVDMVLSNYPKLFEKDVIIVVGENATQIEMEGAQAIAENLGNLTGNVPVIKKDVEITEKEKAGYNLILVGTPGINKVLTDVYNRTNVTRVTREYPGEYKGILEILKNPWNESKNLLLVEGSNERGVKVGNLIMNKNKNLEHQTKVFVDWEEYSGVKFPIDSPEEAIKYATTDPDVEKFIERSATRGINVKKEAELDKSGNIWLVFFRSDENWLGMEININGTILRKGYGI